MNNPVLSLEGVSKKYRSGSEELTVLDNITVRLEHAAITAVTGESGCGKSTLLNLIGGLDSPTAGTIRIGSYEVGSLDEEGLTEYRRKVLGFIFQFHYLLKEFTALENVMMPALIAGKPRKSATARAEELLSEVGLEGRRQHYPTQLSGGERQRVAVARALINDPLLILADEPTGNLDEGNSRIVEDLLFSLVRKHGKTLVLVTHDRRLAEKGDRRYNLHRGELAAT
jgi:lipoprotein-releasing system ATP-binding protein